MLMSERHCTDKNVRFYEAYNNQETKDNSNPNLNIDSHSIRHKYNSDPELKLSLLQSPQLHKYNHKSRIDN